MAPAGNSATAPGLNVVPIDSPACAPGYTAPDGKRAGKNAAWEWIDAASNDMQAAIDKVVTYGDQIIAELENRKNNSDA